MAYLPDAEPQPALTLRERIRALRDVTASFLEQIPACPEGAHDGQVVFSVLDDATLMANGTAIWKPRSVPPLQWSYENAIPPQLTAADIQHARDQLDAARYAIPRIGYVTVHGDPNRTAKGRMAQEEDSE